MTKQRLSQLSGLKMEIQELTERIKRIESMLDGQASRIDGMPWVGGHKDLVGDMVPKLEQLRDTLTASRQRALDEYNGLQHYIETIEDTHVRLIFTLRYMDGLSWHQVAWRMGGNTGDSVRMVHNRYLSRQPTT